MQNEDFSDSDARWMQMALELAAKGQGYVEPNPMVGCVLVKNGNCIGRGFHTAFGKPHAEREAIRNAMESGNESQLRGSTAYVTLEPCCHVGKTPPCTEALLEAEVRRVVVAMPDPFPKVSGGGFAILRQAGIEVNEGLLRDRAERLNAPYLMRQQSQRPWIIAKWAMSVDGRIASKTGHSQWITGKVAREDAHLTRGRVDGVMVGINTVLADDPMLNARCDNSLPRIASRIVIDSQLRIPLDCKLVQSSDEISTLVLCGPQADESRHQALENQGVQVFQRSETNPNLRLSAFLKTLADEFQMTNVLVEGGSRLLGSLLELQAIDQCHVYIAPKYIGGEGALSPIGGVGFDRVDVGPELFVKDVLRLGDDVKLVCERR